MDVMNTVRKATDNKNDFCDNRDPCLYLKKNPGNLIFRGAWLTGSPDPATAGCQKFNPAKTK